MSGGIDSSRFQGALSAYWAVYEGLSKQYDAEYSECQRETNRVGSQLKTGKSESRPQEEMKSLAQRISQLYQDLQKGAEFLLKPHAIPRFKESEASIDQVLWPLSDEICAKRNQTAALRKAIKEIVRSANIQEERRVKGAVASLLSRATGTGAYQEASSSDMSIESRSPDDPYELGRALDAYQIVYDQLIARHDKIAEELDGYLEGIQEKTEAWKQVSASENPDADKQKIEQAMKDMNDHYKRICRLSDHLTKGWEFLELSPIPEFRRKIDADDLKKKAKELLVKRDSIYAVTSEIPQKIRLAETEGNKAIARIDGRLPTFRDWWDWAGNTGAYREDSGYGEYTSSRVSDDERSSSRGAERRTHTFGKTETVENSEETRIADGERRSDLIDDTGSFSGVLERTRGRDDSESWEEQDRADGSGQGTSSGCAISELNSNFDGILADYRELPGTVRATKLFSGERAPPRRRNGQGSFEDIERDLGEILGVSPIQPVRDNSYGNVDELDLDASGSSMRSQSLSAMTAGGSREEEAALSAQVVEESDAGSVGTEDGPPYILEELIVSGDELFDSESSYDAKAEALSQMGKGRSFYSVEELSCEQSDVESQIGNTGSIGDREFPRLGRTDETTSGETPNAAKTLGGMVSKDPLEPPSAPPPQPKKRNPLIRKLFRKKPQEPQVLAAPSPMKEEELHGIDAREEVEHSQNSVRIEDDSFV